jgi:ATP-binding cassette, subfamily B, bacterial MsbA
VSNYFRILRFALPYRREIFLSAVCNILTVLFSLGSITILIPVLKILFQNTPATPEPIPYQGLVQLKPFLESRVNYHISHWIAQYGPQKTLLSILGVATAFFLLKNLFRYFGAISLTFIKNGVERDLRNVIHHKILQLPPAWFTEKRKGDIVARLTTDVLEIQWALLSSIQRMIQDPLMILSTLALLIILSPKLTLFVSILIPITGFVITTVGNSLKRPAAKAKEEAGKILSHVEEHIGGLPIIQSYVAEDRIQKTFEETNHRHFSFMNQTLFRRELSSPISEVLGSMVIIAIVWFGANLILQSNALQPEIFITYIVLFYQVINPAKSISTAIYDIKRGDASAARIFSVLDTVNPITDKPDARPKSGFDREISFKNLSFQYQENKVLSNFNLIIPKGSTVALVGQSGSGKTTLAKLLNRFYDPVEGAIEIDGTDIRDMRIHDLRRLIGYISQDPVLFNDTIRNNLLLGKPGATEEELIEAARIANAHDFILATEQGYDTRIGDQGMKLSGGQRQRITIARAVLKNPPILVLDEATSSLDSESEKLVQDALEKIMTNRTAIIIAHRLSTIQHADQIVVMREGSIVEKGTHQSLMQRDGEYRKLVELQAF